MTLQAYIPQDRLQALVGGKSLPDRTNGSVLFADISGFTALAEGLRDSLGIKRGAEELTTHINRAFSLLIAEVDRYAGSVIDFAGDAIMCWFDDEQRAAPQRAIACALAMQAAMKSLEAIALPDGATTSLALKVSVATGSARRFIVGDPSINYIDTLAGAAVARAALGEHLATKGDVLADEATVNALGNALGIREWRDSADSDTTDRFAVVQGFADESIPPVTPPANEALPVNEMKAWVPAALFEREQVRQNLIINEFRRCVALFVRFTGIEFDSDAAGSQLNEFLRLLQRITMQYQGTVLQITIGDKGSYAYVSLGALTMHENNTRRAVKLALELREAVTSLNYLIPLQIGIAEGIMLIGAYGSANRKTFAAIGDDVNLAARLMMTASPGEILISGQVHKSIANEFVAEARLPVTMKGKSEPVQVFSVLEAQQQRAVRLKEPAYSLPMIGREKELGLISQKLALVTQGHGQIIGVTGDAGMGKSRLVAEGIRLAHRSKLVGYGGECHSDSVNTPYLVWQSIWNAFFDLDPSMPLRKLIRSIEGDLEDKVPEHVDALPLLGTVLGLTLPENDFSRALQPKDRKGQLETVLVKCLEESASEAFEQGGGLLLVLEDTQWIDPVSLDLLELVARAIEDLPILILLTYRPHEANTVIQPVRNIESLAHFTEIKLTELSAGESEQAIRGKLLQLFPEQKGTATRFLLERITNLAQGNPFYVEELLNFISDRGVDLRDEDAMKSLDLPTSLHSLILSRIDQLTPSQQLSLKVASIIGRAFQFKDLLSYYPWTSSTDTLKSDLDMLARVELTPLENPEPELTYLFKHLVTLEVGYESIAYGTRAQLHGLYARYLEDVYPDKVEQLAYHFEQAQIREEAIRYLIKAGEQAAANYANTEALSYFNRALKLTTDEKTRDYFDTLLKRERVYDLLGMRMEQRRDLADLSRLAETFDDAATLRAQIYIRRAQFDIDTGNYSSAKSEAQEAAKTLNQSSNLMVDALLLETRAMFFSGQAVAAKPQLESALTLAREQGYVRGEYNTLASLGLWNWYNGDNYSATELMKQSLTLIRQAGDIRRESDILNNLGIFAKDMYQFSDAIGYYQTAQAIAKKIGDRSGEASLLTNMGRACLTACDYSGAEKYSIEAAALAAEVNEPTTRGLALHNCSEALRELGQYATALECANESLKLLRSSGYRVGEANGLENIAMIESAQGKFEQALEHAQQALGIAREVSSRRVEASTLTRVGLIQLKMKNLGEAENAFTEAERIESEIDEPILSFEIKAGLAEIALGRGAEKSCEQAEPHIEKLINEILREPASEQSRIIPLGSYLTAIRVLRACNDPRANALIGRAESELRLRSEQISDAPLRESYLGILEHTAILNFAKEH